MLRDPRALSLLDALSETGYHSTVIATYCCYFPFYEEVLLRRLLNRGCTNNILMVDATLCAEAFARDDTRPRRAGLDYTLIPVDLHGAFHPKLIVALGKSKGALFVGSHNATLAGFGLNDEVTNEFRAGNANDRQGADVIRAALDYLQGFVPDAIPSVAEVFGAVRENVPWLNRPPAEESGGRVFLTTRGDDADLWGQIRPLMPKRLTTAFVCGPFFDSNLAFLQRLLDDVKPERLIVGIDPETVEIDPSAVHEFHGAEFVNVAGVPRLPNRRNSGVRYLHAKILWFKSSDEELLVTGSANPSRAAFLIESERRNAEAIVADLRDGAGNALGLDDLVAAPAVEEENWSQVSARQSQRAGFKREARGITMLAVPSNEGFVLDQPIGAETRFDAFAANGSAVGTAATDLDEWRVLRAAEVVRVHAHTLCECGPRAGLIRVLVHRPEVIGKNLGGKRQRELRQALGALEEDPTQLEALLKVIEKVIFDSDDSSSAEPASTRRESSTSGEEAPDHCPESLAVEASGRHTRQKKRQAEGDLLVLLDALIYGLGKGLSTSTGSPSESVEVRPGIEDDLPGEDDELPLKQPDFSALAKAARGKSRRLIGRMVKQLKATRDGSAKRTVVQLAAVLGTVFRLRRKEQSRDYWSRRLRLIDPDDERRLLEVGGLAMAWNNSSLGPRAIRECNGEQFQELSQAISLLAWLAWDIQIDVTARLERTHAARSETEDGCWHIIQAIASIANTLARDPEARDMLTDAVSETGKKGIDGKSWVTRYLRLADYLAGIANCPDAYVGSRSTPRSGDLVILSPRFDPRVRVALEVVPGSKGDKIVVSDPEKDTDTAQFLADRLGSVEWGTKGVRDRIS